MGDLNDLFGPNGPNLQNVSPPVQLALMLGLSTLLPAALMTLTSFTRVVIVLSFVRQGLATQNVPPNLVVTGLALFLTMFIMQPTFAELDRMFRAAGFSRSELHTLPPGFQSVKVHERERARRECAVQPCGPGQAVTGLV